MATEISISVIVVTAAKQWEWEEDAYLLGVSHVITLPIREKLLNHFLERVLAAAPAMGREAAAALPSPENRAERMPVRVNPLEAMRKFSAVLAHSLEPRALLREFLLLLREVIGVNRAIIFLRHPLSLGGGPVPEKAELLAALRVRHRDRAFLFRSLRAESCQRPGRPPSQAWQNPPEHQPRGPGEPRDGAGVPDRRCGRGDPNLDRQTLLGVALLDERLTGGAYESDELSLLFDMLEEVALAIRNSWLHEQLQSSHSMFAEILGNLATACVVVGSDLAILHCNNAARSILLPGEKEKRLPEFSDLPQDLGSRVFTVLKTGAAAPAFKYQFLALPGRSHRVAIPPFRAQMAPGADAALLIIEDITAIEHAKRPEPAPPSPASNGGAPGTPRTMRKTP